MMAIAMAIWTFLQGMFRIVWAGASPMFTGGGVVLAAGVTAVPGVLQALSNSLVAALVFGSIGLGYGFWRGDNVGYEHAIAAANKRANVAIVRAVAIANRNADKAIAMHKAQTPKCPAPKHVAVK